MANPPRRHGASLRLCRVLAVLALVPHGAPAHLAARRTEDRELVELKLNVNWNLKSVATLGLGSPPQSTGFEVNGEDMVWLQATHDGRSWWSFEPPPPAAAENWTGCTCSTALLGSLMSALC